MRLSSHQFLGGRGALSGKFTETEADFEGIGEGEDESSQHKLITPDCVATVGKAEGGVQERERALAADLWTDTRKKVAPEWT